MLITIGLILGFTGMFLLTNSDDIPIWRQEVPHLIPGVPAFTLWTTCITPSLLASACFWHFLVIAFQLFILHVWLRITDEGSVPEMCIWSILLIKSDLNLEEVSFYIVQQSMVIITFVDARYSLPLGTISVETYFIFTILEIGLSTSYN